MNKKNFFLKKWLTLYQTIPNLTYILYCMYRLVEIMEVKYNNNNNKC